MVITKYFISLQHTNRILILPLYPVQHFNINKYKKIQLFVIHGDCDIVRIACIPSPRPYHEVTISDRVLKVRTFPLMITTRGQDLRLSIYQYYHELKSSLYLHLRLHT